MVFAIKKVTLGAYNNPLLKRILANYDKKLIKCHKANTVKSGKSNHRKGPLPWRYNINKLVGLVINLNCGIHKLVEIIFFSGNNAINILALW